MKKIISLIVQAILISNLALTAIACRNFLVGGSGGSVETPELPTKDIAYYQDLIVQNNNDIADCDEMLKEIKDNRDGYDNQKDYQSALDEVTAEKFQLKAEINEYQYQILLLEKQQDKFTLDQIIQAITIFTERSTNLEQELKLKEKYTFYYPEAELQVIRNEITAARNMLKIFEDLEEDEENVIINFIKNCHFSR